MNGKKRMNKSALAVSISLFLVLFLLICTFVVSQAKRNEEAIILPAEGTVTDVAPMPDVQLRDTMLQVTPDNVVKILETLQKPVYYHQRMKVAVGSRFPKAVTELELWKNGELLRAQCIAPSGTKVKSVLTDGLEAWIWYDTDFSPIFVELRNVTMDDLLGLPRFDYLTFLKTANVTNAGYRVFEETLQQCVYVETQEPDGRKEQFWIDLHTGLLQMVCVLEENETVYELRSMKMEMLSPGDRAFEGRFCLPDGSLPFTQAE